MKDDKYLTSSTVSKEIQDKMPEGKPIKWSYPWLEFIISILMMAFCVFYVIEFVL